MHHTKNSINTIYPISHLIKNPFLIVISNTKYSLHKTVP